MSSISVENLIAEEFICFVVTGYVSTYLVFFSNEHAVLVSVVRVMNVRGCLSWVATVGCLD
jgi:hypothetical protein